MTTPCSSTRIGCARWLSKRTATRPSKRASWTLKGRSRAKLPILDSPDAVLSRKALRALAVVREARDRDVLLAVMRKLASPDKNTREIAEQELSRFPAEYVSQSRSGNTPAGGSR